MSGEMEAPRIRLVGTRLAPPLEMARWLLEERKIPYCEQAHAPIFHTLVSKKNRAKIELPLALMPEGNWAGIKDFLTGLDEMSRHGEKVFGETEGDRLRAIESVDVLYDKLFWPAVQTYYHHMLQDRQTVLRYALDRAPWWQKAVVRMLFPLWKKAMIGGMTLKEFDPERAAVGIAEVFDFVEEQLSEDRRFLGGDSPNGVDIVFASLAVPVLLPGRFPSDLPALDELPDGFQKLVNRFRSRPGGELVERIYSTRPEEQKTMTVPSRRRSLVQLLVRPKLLVAAARGLGRVTPIFSFRKQTFVLSWRHVTDVLERDADFVIEPVNRKKVDAANGPFILGMDRSPELYAQRELIYGALRAADKNPVIEVLKTEPERLLSIAHQRHGRIDVVNSYARMVATRVSIRLFGVKGRFTGCTTRLTQ